MSCTTHCWSYGYSRGSVTLPVGRDVRVEFDPDTLTFYCWDPAEKGFLWDRTFHAVCGVETTVNEEVLVHARTGHFREAGIENFQAGGFLPERVVKKNPNVNPEKYGHAFLRPDEITPRLAKKAVAITRRYRNGREIIVK